MGRSLHRRRTKRNGPSASRGKSAGPSREHAGGDPARLLNSPETDLFLGRIVFSAGQRAKGAAMQDMQAQAEKLRVDAEDCALISKLATDPNKRDLFARLAAHLSTLASEVEKAIATTLREQANDPLHQGDDEAG